MQGPYPDFDRVLIPVKFPVEVRISMGNNTAHKPNEVLTTDQLFVQQLLHTDYKKIIEALHYGPLRGIHQLLVDSPCKEPIMEKAFPSILYHVIMNPINLYWKKRPLVSKAFLAQSSVSILLTSSPLIIYQGYTKSTWMTLYMEAVLAWYTYRGRESMESIITWLCESTELMQHTLFREEHGIIQF